MIEKCLIEHCAPTLASLKAANLFNACCEEGENIDLQISRWNQLMNPKGVKLLATKVDGVDMNGLRDLGDQLKGKLGEGVVVIASVADGKVNLMATATDGALKQGAHAGNLIKGIAALVGGGGGGRPNMAQAGGKNPAGVDAALAEAAKVLEGQIE